MPYICTALASPVLLSEHTAGAQLSVTANIIICFSSGRAFQKAVIPLPPHPLPPHPPEPPAPQAHPGVGPHITRLDGSHQLWSKMKLEKLFFFPNKWHKNLFNICLSVSFWSVAVPFC